MSFIVKSLLGENVVHPQECETEDSTIEKGEEQQDKQRIPTRTLIIRVQSCTVAQDRRDALKELQTCSDLPYVMAAKEVSYLCNMLRNFPDDDEIVESSLSLLAGITDLVSYPTGSSTYTVSEKEKRRIRDSFLHELVIEVPLFLGHVREGSFWSRFHAVQILQRLQEYDSSSVHKLLLSSHGIGVLVDILNDNNHGGALRNEGLVLITAITATDTELQTLLAFDNAFETLFSVIKEEGGLDGGVIVSDCLTIAHNMLRNNKATQKLFREMGCARLVCTLLEAVPERVRNAIEQQKKQKGTQRKKRVNEDVDNDLIETPFFTPLTNSQNVVLLMAVSILNCILREAELHQEITLAQDALLQSGVLNPLTSLALGGVAIDDAARVEAMRTLAILLNDRRLGIEKFIQIQVMTMLRSESPLHVEEWSALRATLYVLLEVEDGVMQSASAQLIHSLLSVSVCEGRVANMFLKNFTPPVSSSSSSASSPMMKIMKNTIEKDCGMAISNALFYTPSSSSSNGFNGKYFAALLLDRLLSLSTNIEQLSISELNLEIIKPNLIKNSFVSSNIGNNNFLAYTQYVIKCFRGYGEMDLNTLSACFRCLLRWIITSEGAVQLFLTDLTHYKSLLQRARQDNGPVHVKFWSATLCAALCVAAPLNVSTTKYDKKSLEESKRSETDKEEEEVSKVKNTLTSVNNNLSPLMERRQLLELFFNHLGGPTIFDSFLFDVKASSPVWSDPPKNAFLRPVPVLYDEGFKKTILNIIQEFNNICPSPRGGVREITSNKLVEEPSIANFTSSLTNAPRIIYPPQERLSIAEGSSHSSVIGISTQPSLQITQNKQQSMTIIPTTTAAEGVVENSSSSATTNVTGGEVDNTLRDVYEAKVQELTTKNIELENELKLLRERVNFDAAQREADEEREKQHIEEVNLLKENIKLLEDALSAEQEEHRNLAQSLNMLEEQLRLALANRGEGETESLVLRHEIQKLTQERDNLLILTGMLDEELTPRRSIRQESVCSSSALPIIPPLSSSNTVIPYNNNNNNNNNNILDTSSSLQEIHHVNREEGDVLQHSKNFIGFGGEEPTPTPTPRPQHLQPNSNETTELDHSSNFQTSQLQFEQQTPETNQIFSFGQRSTSLPLSSNGVSIIPPSRLPATRQNPFSGVPSNSFMNLDRNISESQEKQFIPSSMHFKRPIQSGYNPFANMAGVNNNDDDDIGDLR